ncbi:ribonucleotide-diphosphate reductase subunit beta [Elizabethkingia sp. JS20170427COW]|uniref:ribonucleotide-diphosphate reductase subunit beta n=1 Tax=Elizabethkingia sp. JS20170427COW TaxID=2583851 RepID=UPI0011107C04|nr:ribonucleotide-diphosphate reductase subunit beta [Elizabethkingia sp. JS20170427COW]QCX52728.1 ribonucleotide-diphosphate reductase subunit beta [Elizabethkingia sp. JS20170427COW]
MGIFDKRINYKPFEYPEVLTFIEAINKSYWVHSEVDFTADIQDFKANLNPTEKEVVKRSLLSIAQIEVAVKAFWGDLYKHFPKPEINGLGSTFAESEFRHSEAYSRLLEVLGYNEEFAKALESPIFRERVEMVSDGLDTDSIAKKLLFFTVIVENSSLFSQFANILSFTRFKGYMKNTSNIIAWTSIDEQTHANAGIYLINKIREEGHPVPTQEEVSEFAKNALDFEEKLLSWIYENGELEFFTKTDMLNFMRYRVDEALVNMGYEKVFHTTAEEYKPMKWFEEDVFANELDDFFAKRPTAYTKHDKSITANDLF